MNLNQVQISTEVIHPYNYKIRGYDKLGAMLIFKNNRGWWTRSIMDEFDSNTISTGKYSPIHIQILKPILKNLQQRRLIRYVNEYQKSQTKFSIGILYFLLH